MLKIEKAIKTCAHVHSLFTSDSLKKYTTLDSLPEKKLDLLFRQIANIGVMLFSVHRYIFLLSLKKYSE